MKRQHIIERLVAANYTSSRILNGLNNEHLRSLYDEVWPRILMRMERTERRSKREQAELEAKRRFELWQKEWLKNWVHPKVKYPLTGPGRIFVPEKPKFGINELASTLVKTLVEQTKKAEHEHESKRRRNHKTGKPMRNNRRRFRVPNAYSLSVYTA